MSMMLRIAILGYNWFVHEAISGQMLGLILESYDSSQRVEVVCLDKARHLNYIVATANRCPGVTVGSSNGTLL